MNQPRLFPMCPSEDCPMCAGEICGLCGAGVIPVWHECEHDVIERHEPLYAVPVEEWICKSCQYPWDECVCFGDEEGIA